MIKPQLLITSVAFLALSGIFSSCSESNSKTGEKSAIKANGEISDTENEVEPIDTAVYNRKIQELANGDTTGKWPVKKQPYPLAGAILPYKRVVTYYGNLYSKKMGALGEYAPKEMLRMLYAEVSKWEKIDPKTPVQPALHYIAVVAAGDPGKDGKYRNRMPDKQIDSVLTIAKMKKDMIVFLDIQVALSTIREELPRLEKYLKMPNVHLGIDPEFSMKGGQKPGSVIGSFDAADVNYVASYLTDLVNKYNLPPKILVLHRFTQSMLKNTALIEKRPEVQFVVDMDGWGAPSRKIETYKYFVAEEPVQFTGFKLFYKNDLKHAPNRLLTPAELLTLKPVPMYIQYQ